MTRVAVPAVVLDYSSDVDLGNETPSVIAGSVPDATFVKRWIEVALGAPEVTQAVANSQGTLDGEPAEIHVSVHLTDELTSQALNRDLRGSDNATNVLSFPAGLPALDGTLTLGELVLCPVVVQEEAREQAKAHEDHWAHLLIHGTLHLAGFDHVEDAEAELMESLEIRLLSESGISDPYEGTV